MKIKLTVTLLLCFSFFSCTKERFIDNTDYLKVPSELIGSWNWIETTGGIALAKYNSAITGEAITIELDSLNNFRYISNGSLRYETKFKLMKTTSVFNPRDTVIEFKIDPFPLNLDYKERYWENISYSYYSLRSSGRLVFNEASFDGFTHYYSKSE
jgi:hypothetical protein